MRQAIKIGVGALAPLSVALAFLSVGGLALAQSPPPDAQSRLELRAQLEQALADLEKQIAEYDQQISATGEQKQSLQNEISKLKKEIARLDLEVRRTGVLIASVADQISVKELDIQKAEDRIGSLRFDLSEILRRIQHQDQRPAWDILLSDGSLANFMSNITELLILQAQNNDLLNRIKALKLTLESERGELVDQQEALQRNVQLQTLQRQQQAAKQAQRNDLLKLTEAQYQDFLVNRQAAQAKANEIRARIFELVGVTEAPTFGQAYEIAQQVNQLTLIRPAFLLAILTQESNLGKNVGQCYLRDPVTGAGVGANTGNAYVGVMAPGPPYHPKRNDVAVFLAITQALGRDPFATRVSCPINSPERGLIAGKNSWGGAMGPAQFIPTTWRGYEERLKALTGSADPWSIRDAFTAAALMLKNAGAAAQTRDAEWRAALVYFSGGFNPQYRFYADSVLAIADRYEDDIKALAAGS